MTLDHPAAATGRCLCDAVSYEVRGPMRDVLMCHCIECRRWNGHFSASTAVARDDLVLVEQRGLRWFDSPDSDLNARRGFCAECGSSLFWEAADRATISIAAGSLDTPTGLRTAGHWYVSQVGDYYELGDDGLPRRSRGSGRESDVTSLRAPWVIPASNPTGRVRSPHPVQPGSAEPTNQELLDAEREERI
jgi:hypothetical protein